MSDYLPTAREHDATWLLQREILHNEALRDNPAKHRRRYELLPGALNLHPADPTEQDRALKVLTRAAATAGLTPDDFREVLEALGLTPEPARQPATTLDRPGRRHGRCRWCHRYSIPLRVDGTLTAHARTPGQRHVDNPCPGDRTRPQTSRKAAA